jgi:hypothetical protein
MRQRQPLANQDSQISQLDVTKFEMCGGERHRYLGVVVGWLVVVFVFDCFSLNTKTRSSVVDDDVDACGLLSLSTRAFPRIWVDSMCHAMPCHAMPWLVSSCDRLLSRFGGMRR